MTTAWQRWGGAFICGAALGSAVSLALVWRLSSRSVRGNLEEPQLSGQGGCYQAVALRSDLFTDDILSEHLTRNIQFFGPQGQQRIGEAFVVVVGLGGVGSHAAHLLLRSGVGRLRLIDFDQVSLSSLNRHAVATRADVGKSKVACLVEHFGKILPEADVEGVNAMFTRDNTDTLLQGNPTYVIDAIDNIDTKVDLLAACQRLRLPVLCVAGAGAKADPTRLRIVDISESSVDPLARAVRQKLRRQHGIVDGIQVLLSTEKPRCDLVSLVDSANSNPQDYQLIPNFRIRTIPVLGTSPAGFGIAAASFILCTIAGAPFAGEPIIKLQEHQYERQMQRLIDREVENFGTDAGVGVDMDDVRYLVREVWRGFSARSTGAALPGGDKGLMRSTANLVLIRWDATQPARVDNLVLLTFDEALAHEHVGLKQLQATEPSFVAKVEGVLQRARQHCM